LEFLLISPITDRNYASILHIFRVIASYLSKVAYFNLPHLHLAPPLGDPVRISRDLGDRKRVPWAIVWRCFRDSTIRLAAMTQYRHVTDGQT